MPPESWLKKKERKLKKEQNCEKWDHSADFILGSKFQFRQEK